MEKYFINVRKDQADKNGEFLLNGCYLDVEHPDGSYTELIGRIVELTPSGYRSNKDIKFALDIVCEDEDGCGSYITKECAILLVDKFPNVDYKVWVSPEQRARDKNAAGWNYVAQNFITDPYCTQ